MKRIYFLDLIRVFLAIMVFCHHSAISFGALGDWYYLSRDSVSGITQVLLSVNMGVDQAYFMSLFFFISAYFLPGTIDRSYKSSGNSVAIILFCIVSIFGLLDLWFLGKAWFRSDVVCFFIIVF